MSEVRAYFDFTYIASVWHKICTNNFRWDNWKQNKRCMWNPVWTKLYFQYKLYKNVIEIQNTFWKLVEYKIQIT